MTATREYTPKIVTSTCLTCGTIFSYSHSTGMRKKHCSTKCREAAKVASRSIREMALPNCSIDGCCNTATRVGSGMCDKHYCRVRRGAPMGDKNFAYRYKTSGGYVSMLDAEHPLAKEGGMVYEHRVVAYEKHNGKCPGCFWCRCSLTWPDSVIDHLDENKVNNDKDNLVVACTNCNRARGAMLPFIKGMSKESMAVFIDQAMKYRAAQAPRF